jgi:chromosome segregation ATPase
MEQSLTILSLAEPLLNSDHANRLTKSSLDAELQHYKDLFSKLRFSYVEQVTKERFLKAIIADPPELPDAAENARLEIHLAEAKTALKAKKNQTNQKVQELQELGTRLAQSHDLIHLQTAQLDALPTDIRNLQTTIAALKATQDTPSSQPMLNLPLQPTISLLSDKEAELAALDRQLAALNSALPHKKRRLADLKADVEPVESRKRAALTQAKDAQKKRGQHAQAQHLDERGKWLKSVDTGLRLMLQI